MKNIHIIPTDKASRLVQRRITKEIKTSSLDNPQLWNNINIYITSDEEIKEGDWFYDLDSKYVKIKQSWENSHLDFNAKKIILTTHHHLIKDGVQAIDDEFLEWFVKNPSCEFVPIITTIVQDEAEYKTNIGFESWRKEEPKQETLEEAAEFNFEKQVSNPYSTGTAVYTAYEKGFELGAKWQAERMYSEKDMRKAFEAGELSKEDDINGDGETLFEEWFEQHKKK
jgi:hypothetical protein